MSLGRPTASIYMAPVSRFGGVWKKLLGLSDGDICFKLEFTTWTNGGSGETKEHSRIFSHNTLSEALAAVDEFVIEHPDAYVNILGFEVKHNGR